MAHKGRSKTSKFLRKNPKSAAKKRKYDKEYRKREKGSKAPHSAKNRGRNGKNGRSTKK